MRCVMGMALFGPEDLVRDAPIMLETTPLHLRCRFATGLPPLQRFFLFLVKWLRAGEANSAVAAIAIRMRRIIFS